MATLTCCRLYSRNLLNLTQYQQQTATNKLKLQCRYYSMFAWKVGDSLDNQNEVSIKTKLRYVETKQPTISSPSDVLIKVHSTSVNPLDIRMIYGYGRRVLDLLDIVTNCEPRITNDRYPLTLGRDFSGEVIATGPSSSKTFYPGDLVYGAVDPQRSGTHAEYISVPSYSLTKKPSNLSHSQAASIPFVALTAYSALCTFGHLSKDQCHGKQVLIIGGSGGVGSFAIQLLKLWGANVFATCSEEKIKWLEEELFVDKAVCYKDSSLMDSLNGKFDFILDCGNYDGINSTRQDIVKNALNYLKPRSQSVYVTLSPPILSNTDQHGLIKGTAQTALDAFCDTLMGLNNLNSARWAVYTPNKWALDYVSELFASEAISPQVGAEFDFSDMPEAYEELRGGKVKGKVVVNVTNLGTKPNEKSSKQQEERQPQQISEESKAKI